MRLFFETGVLVVVCMMSCYLVTRVMSGQYREDDCCVEMACTNRNVVLEGEDGNKMIDVEEYVAGVLPTVVSWDEAADVIEAQAVAVRTRIYYLMGDATVINSKDTGYEYIDKDEWIKRLGRENYMDYKQIYEKAVLKTIGKVAE